MRKIFALLALLATADGCSSLQSAGKCGLFSPTPTFGKAFRISGLYSSSPMHGAVLVSADCPGVGRRVFGEDTATGPAASEFLSEIHGGPGAYRHEYQIDVSAQLVPDEDGPMLEIQKIWSFKKK